MAKRRRLSQQDWIQAGMRALSSDGPSALKAETLARSLKTTKGSFYWHFLDVAAFHHAIMEFWEARAYSDIVAALDRLPDPRQRLRRLGQIVTNAAPHDYGGAALEPAIRAWARSSDEIAAAVRRVDQKRIAYLANQLEQIGISNPDFARMIYAAYIGFDDLLVLDGQENQSAMGSLVDLILALE